MFLTPNPKRSRERVTKRPRTLQNCVKSPLHGNFGLAPAFITRTYEVPKASTCGLRVVPGCLYREPCVLTVNAQGSANPALKSAKGKYLGFATALATGWPVRPVRSCANRATARANAHPGNASVRACVPAPARRKLGGCRTTFAPSLALAEPVKVRAFLAGDVARAKMRNCAVLRALGSKTRLVRSCATKAPASACALPDAKTATTKCPQRAIAPANGTGERRVARSVRRGSVLEPVCPGRASAFPAPRPPAAAVAIGISRPHANFCVNKDRAKALASRAHAFATTERLKPAVKPVPG